MGVALKHTLKRMAGPASNTSKSRSQHEVSVPQHTPSLLPHLAEVMASNAAPSKNHCGLHSIVLVYWSAVEVNEQVTLTKDPPISSKHQIRPLMSEYSLVHELAVALQQQQPPLQPQCLAPAPCICSQQTGLMSSQPGLRGPPTHVSEHCQQHHVLRRAVAGRKGVLRVGRG